MSAIECPQAGQPDFLTCVAATHIPDSVRRNHPEIPWRMIITRNQLIHGYVGIDDDVLWSIVRTDIPDLLANLRILQAQEPD